MNEHRIGDYCETFTGRQFWPLDPREEEICIEDIAHQLALTNRFGGATCVPYSVADHSVRVSWNASINRRVMPITYDYDGLWGLLHDAAEAYLNDVPRPVKHHPEFAFYRRAEENLLRCIARKFGLPEEVPQVVKDADEILLATEARDLMTPGALERWTPMAWEPLPNRLIPLDWQVAEIAFLERFHELTS